MKGEKFANTVARFLTFYKLRYCEKFIATKGGDDWKQAYKEPSG